MRPAQPRLAPGILVLLATGFDALFPLAVAIGMPVDSPLIFSAGIVVGFGLTSIAYLALTNRTVFKTVWRMPAVVGRHLRRPLFGLMLLGRMNRPLFVAAVALTGATLPTIVSGLVPIAYMLMLQRSLGSGRYRRLGWRVLPPLALAFAGVSLVVASQPINSTGRGWWLLAAGLVISLASVAAAGLTTLDLAWGVDYARQVKPAPTNKDEVAASLLGTVLAVAAVVPGLFIAGLLLQPGGAILAALLPGAVIGVVIRTPFTILLRIANFDTTSVTVDAIVFLAPLISLGLLMGFGYATDVKLPVAIVGGLAIVIANLLLVRHRSRWPGVVRRGRPR